MEFLKRGLALFKAHYEKFLLGFVLLALLAAVGWLLFKIDEEQTAIKKATEARIKGKRKEVKPIDLSRHELDLELAQDPPRLDLGRPHRLFNPLKWQMKPDGTLVPERTGKEFGPEALVVTKVEPLLYTLSFDRAAGTGYQMGEMNQAHSNPRSRGRVQVFVSKDNPNAGKPFILREIKGPADDPAELIFEIMDTNPKELVTVTKDNPYIRTNGYKADLRYPPSNKPFNDCRKDAKLTLEGEDYIISSVTASSVVVFARSNEKKTTISYHSTP